MGEKGLVISNESGDLAATVGTTALISVLRLQNENTVTKMSDRNELYDTTQLQQSVSLFIFLNEENS